MVYDPDLAPFSKWLDPDAEDEELREAKADEFRAERWLITAEEDALIRRFVDLDLRLSLAGYATDRSLMEIKAALEAGRRGVLHLTGFTSEEINRLMDYEEDLSDQWFQALEDLCDYRRSHPMDGTLEDLTPSLPSPN